MRRIALLGLFVFIFCSCYVAAQDYNISYYGFNNTADDYFGRYNSTINPVAVYNTTYPSYAISGNGRVYSFQGNGTGAKINTGIATLTGTDWTIGAWFKSQSAREFMGFFAEYNTGGFFLRCTGPSDTVTNNSAVVYYTNTCGANEVNMNGLLVNGDWHLVVLSYNKTSKVLNFFVDGRLNGTDTCTGDYTAQANNVEFSMSVGAINRNWEGPIDEAFILNTSLPIAEVLNIYNKGMINYSIAAGTNITVSAPVFNFPSPTAAVHNNTQVTYNISCSDGLVNAWFNESQVITNQATPASYTTSVTTDGTYNMTARCYNVSATPAWSTNESRLWIYDITKPVSALKVGNSFNNNGTNNINSYEDLLYLNMTFSDNVDLFAYEVNITKSGVIYFNETNESIIGTSFNYLQTVNTSTWPSGTYDVKVTVTDSHTDGEIPDYQITNKKSSIMFKMFDDNNIKIETDESSTINAEKLVDRYTFNVDFDNSITKDRLFHIKTDKCPLVYRAKSPFKAHFVSYCGDSGNWIDFEGVKNEYVVSKIDDYHWTVLFKNLAPSMTFKSIGGLNFIDYNYSWYNGNAYIIIDPDPVGTNETVKMYLNITQDTTFHSNIKAELLYEGGVYAATQTNSTSMKLFNTSVNVGGTPANRTFDWNVTVTQINGSVLNFNLSSHHHIFSWSMANCSDGNITMQLNLFDEDNPLLFLNGSLEIEMIYWINDASNYKNFTHKFSMDRSFNICLLPSNETFHSDVYASYASENGFTHRYFLYNQSLNNVTLNVSIYNFNSTANISDLRITARDKSSYEYYDLAIAKLQRRYVSEGLWRTVQMDRSGDFGLVFFNIREESVDYRILYYDVYNNLLKETQSLKFSCTSNICELEQLLDPYSATATTSNISVIYSYNNATRLIQVNWSDSQGNNQNVKIRIIKESLTGMINVCDVNQTGASGGYSCNTTGYTGEVLLTVLTANSPFTPTESAWITLTRAALGSLISKSESAFYTIGIMITAIGFGLWSPVAAIVAGLVGLVTLAFLGIFTPLTMTFVIIAIAMGIAIALRVKQ
jgi:hypothetical protein